MGSVAVNRNKVSYIISMSITKTSIVFLFFISLLSCVSCQKNEKVRTFGTVTNVLDGDTVVVEVGNIEYQIHIYGIDAPELHQEYGEIARDILANVFTRNDKSRDVVLFSNDPIRNELVASVYAVSDSRVDIGQLMINSGYAWADSNNVSDYVTGQNIAQSNCKGMWSGTSHCTGIPGYELTPPWEKKK